MHEERPHNQPRYWRDDWFRSLREIAREATQFPAWTGYAAYCTEIERGLRKLALSTLDRFILRMERASFSDRKAFVSWLLGGIDQSPAADILAPYPLRHRLIEPTLNEWLTAEPLCSEPHRWLGGYDHLKEALQLEATDEIARRKFVWFILDSVGYSAHELPQGYLGDPRHDLALLREAEEAAQRLQDVDVHRSAISDIQGIRQQIEQWLGGR